MNLKVVVCGAGEVGTHIASMLSANEYSVTMIDNDPTRIATLAEALDISTLNGSCASGEILLAAGVPDADLLIACTDQDEINLLTAAIAKHMGAKRTVARVEHQDFFDARGVDYSSALSIDGIICPDHSTAQAIARVLRNPGALAIEDFGQDQIEIQEFPVSEEAPALQQPLAKLGLPTGALLAAVRRDNTAFVPTASTVIQQGDIVLLVGDIKVFQQARKLFHQEESSYRQIVIMSGSSIAVWLCRALQESHTRVRLFVPDRERAIELSNELDWVTVIQADVVDATVFEEERVGQADIFVACSDDDERNILACLWAKSNGTKKVVAISDRSDYLGLLKQIGIDYSFSPQNEAAEEIENFLLRTPLRKLDSFVHKNVNVYRVPVGEKSKAIGCTLAQLGRPEDWMIVTIRRMDDCFVPTAEHQILTGDVLLIIAGSHNLERSLSKLFDAPQE